MPNDGCCGGRCRWCNEWRNEPKSAWCATCQATTYRDDDGTCIVCESAPQNIVAPTSQEGQTA